MNVYEPILPDYDFICYNLEAIDYYQFVHWCKSEIAYM